MSPTPTIVPSAIGGNSMRLFPAKGNDGMPCLLIEIHGIGAFEGSATVEASVFAEMLSCVPGFSAKYIKPIEIPQYLGAVIERPRAPRSDGRSFDRYVRTFHDSASSLPWINTYNHKFVSNDDVAAILANGGYEREPEFPQRTP